MREKTIIKISILIIIFGFVFLFFYVDEIDIQTVENLDVPVEEVKIKGTVSKVNMRENVIFLEILGEKVEKMDVVVFDDEDILVEKGHYVEISGEVEEYEGKKEVIASEVVVRNK